MSDLLVDEYLLNLNKHKPVEPAPPFLNKQYSPQINHGHKHCPYTCQECTDERKRFKLNQKKKRRHGRIHT